MTAQVRLATFGRPRPFLAIVKLRGSSIDEGEILAGQLPRKQLRLVQAWIELHRDELMADWELAISGERPYKINPL